MKYIALLILLTSCTSVSYDVYFCPADNCTQVLIELAQTSNDIKCAFYDLKDQRLKSILQLQGADLVLDARNPRMTNAYITRQNHQMHNKFCIFSDSVVSTGSFNPTIRGSTMNNNNLVIIHSKKIAKKYISEFNELKTRKNTPSLFSHNVYFCPEDCSPQIYTKLIDAAQYSVVYLTFSFTHNDIADALIAAHNRGVKVEGIIEKTQNSKYSVHARLIDAGINANLDTNPAFMHHKVFVIDNQIVITGSANPSKNGMSRNDENIVIIDNPEIAQQYTDEYHKLNI